VDHGSDPDRERRQPVGTELSPIYDRDVPRLHQIGWIAFMASAVLFGWSGARAGDALVVGGSIVFGVACVAFLVPAGSRTATRGDDESDEAPPR
jgi:hypothetical protein